MMRVAICKQLSILCENESQVTKLNKKNFSMRDFWEGFGDPKKGIHCEITKKPLNSPSANLQHMQI
jgi:hypothetical protein